MSAIHPRFPPFPKLKACALCGKAGPLKNSHIIPAFVAQDLRATAGTGHIRDNHTPNRRIQDAEKVRMLCGDCEGRFSKWETAFADRVYRPLKANPAFVPDFEGWMSRFGVSLVWRVLKRYLLCGICREPKEPFEDAENTWRRFLVGEAENVGPNEIHFLPMEAPEGVPTPGAVRGLGPIPANWSRYSLTTMGFDLPSSEGSGNSFVYVKLPRFGFFGVVTRGRKSPFIRGTRLPMGKGRLAPRAYRISASIMNYLFEKARETARITAGLSARQKAKIQDAMRADPARILASESFRAMDADVRLFGRSAFRREDPSNES